MFRLLNGLTQILPMQEPAFPRRALHCCISHVFRHGKGGFALLNSTLHVPTELDILKLGLVVRVLPSNSGIPDPSITFESSL